MRIVFDATSCAKEHPGGIGGYGRNLLRACAEVAPEHEYVVGLRASKWLRRRWLDDLRDVGPVRLVFDRAPSLRLGRVDLYHGLGVRLPRGGSFTRSFTLHDVNVFEFPELSSDAWRASRQARIRETIARADRIVTHSEQGADAAVEHLGVERERLVAIPCGVDLSIWSPADDEIVDATVARFDVERGRYLLLVGGYGPRKNQDGLVDAFATAGLAADGWRLLFSGPRGDDAAALARRATEAGVPEDALRLPGFVSTEDLVALQTGAGAYVCASRHEGFGLPVLEAQACGAPVVSSDRGALPETVGDVGLLFDPDDREAFADALRRVARDDALRADLAARGRRRAATDFSWQAAARRYLDAFTSFVGG